MRSQSFVWESYHQYIHIVVSSQGMFVRIDEVIWQLVADIFHGIFSVGIVAEEMVDAVESAL